MFANTSDELLACFRSDVDDRVAPYLWTATDAYGYMTEGFDALMKRTGTKYQTLQLNYLAGAETLPIPSKIVYIRSARIVGGGMLEPLSNDDASIIRDDYGLRVVQTLFDDAPGAPCAFVRDYDQRALRLLPRPATDGVLEIQCTVTLGVAMAAGAALPTTDAEDLRLVLHYMKSLAYQKHDAETEDLVRAKFHEDRFQVGVLQRDASLRNQRRPPDVVQMQGWD